MLCAAQLSEATCRSRTDECLSELFPFHRADLFQAAFDALSSATLRRGICTSLASKWRGNPVHHAIRKADGVLHSGPEKRTISQPALGCILRQWLSCARLDDNPRGLSKF